MTTTNIYQLLTDLDYASVDASNAPDKRRILAQEATELRAALDSGDRERAQTRANEAAQVLSMWSDY